MEDAFVKTARNKNYIATRLISRNRNGDDSLSPTNTLTDEFTEVFYGEG